jgi:hypothetical protein
MNPLKTTSYHAVRRLPTGEVEEINVTRTTNVNGVTATREDLVKIHPNWNSAVVAMRYANGVAR